MGEIPKHIIDIELAFKKQKDRHILLQEAKEVIRQLVQGLIEPNGVDAFLNNVPRSSLKFLITPNPILKWETPIAGLRREEESKKRQKQK